MLKKVLKLGPLTKALPDTHGITAVQNFSIGRGTVCYVRSSSRKSTSLATVNFVILKTVEDESSRSFTLALRF